MMGCNSVWFTFHKYLNSLANYTVGDTGCSMHNCIDEHVEQITGSASGESIHYLYTVYATGPLVPHNWGEPERAPH